MSEIRLPKPIPLFKQGMIIGDAMYIAKATMKQITIGHTAGFVSDEEFAEALAGYITTQKAIASQFDMVIDGLVSPSANHAFHYLISRN